MTGLRDILRRNFRVLAKDAVDELAFMQRHTTVGYIKKQAELLAHNSPEDVNRFLSTSVFRMRERASKHHTVSPKDLYVVTSLVDDEGSFICSYMYGETYYSPPISIPRTRQLRELWQYHLRFHSTYGWYPFQEFVEKKIEEALQALYRYEEMLEMEIVSFDAALMSVEGVSIHNELYRQSVETYAALIEVRKFLQKEKAPHSMVVANSDALKSTARVIRIIRQSKPRGI